MARLIVGVNDLATVNPELAREVSSNSEIKSTEVTVGSGKNLLWRCSKGHEWEARVSHRSKGHSCPYCSNKKVLQGFNDLETTNPKLAKEVSTNSKIKATEVTDFSNRKMLWLCCNGHEWEDSVGHRSSGRGCPYCSNQKILLGFNDLSTTNPELAQEVSSDSKIKVTEVTIGSKKKLLWMCSKGHEWEATVNNRSKGGGCPYCSGRKSIVGVNDLATINPKLSNEVSPNSEIKATRIMAFTNSKILWRCVEGHEWAATVSSRSQGAGCPYCSGRKSIMGVNDLSTTNPDLAKEVSPNSKIKSTEVSAGSGKRVLWRCSKGHEWEAIVSHRSKGRGCPYCSNHRLLIGFNDLATTNPGLAKEVSPNSEIKATEVMAFSNKKLLWVCNNGHEWEATVANRSQGNGCPYCSRRKLIVGVNDLETMNPKLAMEVSPNSKIKATEVTSGSENKLLWRCCKGHEWEAKVYNRSNGNGCPYCSNHKILIGFNDLATTNPQLAKEVSLNSKIKATEVTAGSNKKLLWRCSKGHEWEAAVLHRSQNTGCPKCSGSKMERDFAQLVKTIIPENTDIIHNDRKLIKPYELDVLIPSLNLAFEFNGDYWHSNEMIRERHPHFKTSKQFDNFKKQECEKHGVELFFVREKQWANNYEKTVDRIKRIIVKNLCS